MFYNLLPEIIFSLTALTLLAAGVFVEARLKNDANFINFSVFHVLFITVGLTIYTGISFAFVTTSGARWLYLFDQFLVDGFSLFFKFILLLLFIPILVGLRSYLLAERIYAYEYLVLMCISVLGMFLMLSAQDFLLLYVAIELQALAAYVLAASRTDSRLSAEAGIKYFIIGVLASILLLVGIALLYMYTGSTQFYNINLFLTMQYENFSPVVILALISLWLGLTIKLGAAPLHFWALDTYQGAPLIVTGFFATLPKFALVGLFIRLYYQTLAGFWAPYNVVYGEWTNYFGQNFENANLIVWNWVQEAFAHTLARINDHDLFNAFTKFTPAARVADHIILFPHVTGISQLFLWLGIASLIVGAVGGLSQTNLKRLFAYSSLTNVGFLLLTFVPATLDGLQSLLFYLLVYSFTTINFFFLLLAFHLAYRNPVYSLVDLSRMSPVLAFLATFVLLGLAGIPPTIGFPTKFFVYYLLVANEYYWTALIVVLVSLVAIFFYLRLIVSVYSGGFRNLHLSFLTGSLESDFKFTLGFYFFILNILFLIFAPELFDLTAILTRLVVVQLSPKTSGFTVISDF